MKYVMAIVLALVASSTNADCIIVSKCNPEKYSQQRRSNDNSSISVESRDRRGPPKEAFTCARRAGKELPTAGCTGLLRALPHLPALAADMVNASEGNPGPASRGRGRNSVTPPPAPAP
jgi:hypothetical protein